MAILNFTFDLRHGDVLLAQIDGHAIVDDESIVEVLLEDLETGEFVTVSGDLERQVILFIATHPTYRDCLLEAVEAECAGRVVYDREVGRAA